MSLGTFTTILIGAVCLAFVVTNMILDRKDRKRSEPRELSTSDIIQAMIRKERKP